MNHQFRLSDVSGPDTTRNSSFSAARKSGALFTPGASRTLNPSPPVPEIWMLIPTWIAVPGSGGRLAIVASISGGIVAVGMAVGARLGALSTVTCGLTTEGPDRSGAKIYTASPVPTRHRNPRNTPTASDNHVLFISCFHQEERHRQDDIHRHHGRPFNPVGFSIRRNHDRDQHSCTQGH